MNIHELEQERKIFAEQIRGKNLHPLLLLLLDKRDHQSLLSSSTTQNFEQVYSSPNLGIVLSSQEQADIINALNRRKFEVGNYQFKVELRRPFNEVDANQKPVALFAQGGMDDGTIVVTARLQQRRSDDVPTHTGREISSRAPSSIVFTRAVNDRGEEVCLCISTSKGANRSGITKPGLLLLMQAGVRVGWGQNSGFDLSQQVNTHVAIDSSSEINMRLLAVAASRLLEVRELGDYTKIFEFISARYPEIIVPQMWFNELIPNLLSNLPKLPKDKIPESKANLLLAYKQRFENYQEILGLYDKDDRFARFIGRIRYLLATSDRTDIPKVVDVGLAGILRKIYDGASIRDPASYLFVTQVLDTANGDNLLDALLRGAGGISIQTPDSMSRGQTNRMAEARSSEGDQKAAVIEAIFKLATLLSNFSHDPDIKQKVTTAIASGNLQTLEQELTALLIYCCGKLNTSFNLIPIDLQGKIKLVDWLCANSGQAPQMPFGNHPPFSHYQLPPPYGSHPALPPPANTGSLPAYPFPNPYQTGYYAVPPGWPPPNSLQELENDLKIIFEKFAKQQQEKQELEKFARRTKEEEVLTRFGDCVSKRKPFTADLEDILALSFEGNHWEVMTVYKLAALAAFMQQAQDEDIDALTRNLNSQDKVGSVRQVAELIIAYLKTGEIPINEEHLSNLLEAISEYGKFVADGNKDDDLCGQIEDTIMQELESLKNQTNRGRGQIVARPQQERSTISVATTKGEQSAKGGSGTDPRITRRDFLKAALLLGGLVACGGIGLAARGLPEYRGAVIPPLGRGETCKQGKINNFAEIDTEKIELFAREAKPQSSVSIDPNKRYFLFGYDKESVPYLIISFEGNKITTGTITKAKGGVLSQVTLNKEESQQLMKAMSIPDRDGKKICEAYGGIDGLKAFIVTLETDGRIVQFMGNPNFHIPGIPTNFINGASPRKIQRRDVIMIEFFIG